MRRLTRFDFHRAAFEGTVIFVVLTMACAFCFSPLMEWVGEQRIAITSDNVAVAIVSIVITTVVGFVSALATRVFRIGYKVEGFSQGKVCSYQPALWVAAQTAHKMKRRGIENVRIFEPSGTEVPRNEWEVGSPN